ncbi:type II toxin-antitoxin system PemK/MazF family toxin [Patescibacteria group bacterium]|nr:type II toxin-antitoxin system PemK/MazF family toxin [Patescibacteria group bacterium]
MQKDFQKWHDKKSKVDEIKKRPFFHEREIWYCTLGVNIGFEQDGGGEDFLRPVIIIRKFNNEIFWAIPLTRTQKKTKYYFQFVFGDNFSSAAILSQIRLVDARRLDYKIGDISKDNFKKLIKKFKDLLP